MEATTNIDYYREITVSELPDFKKFISAMVDYAKSDVENRGIKDFDYKILSRDCGANVFLGIVSTTVWNNSLTIVAIGDHFDLGKKRNFLRRASPKFGPYAQSWNDLNDFYSDIDNGRIKFLSEEGKIINSDIANTQASTMLSDPPQQKATTIDSSEKQLPDRWELKASAVATPKTTGWPGNKFASDIYKQIINQLPPHDLFISGFMGTCAVMASKKPAAGNIGVDLALEAPRVQSFWSSLQRKDIKFLRQDFFEFIKGFTWNKQMKQRIILYLDPPYELNFRRSGKACYEHELTTEQHAELIKIVRHLTEMSNVMIAISHFPHPTYDELLNNGWRKIEYKFRSRMETITDALYMNYPEPTELHEYTFLGRDKTDRQRIKRKVTGFARKLMNLPPLERMAIVTEVSKLSTLTPPIHNRRK